MRKTKSKNNGSIFGNEERFFSRAFQQQNLNKGMSFLYLECSCGSDVFCVFLVVLFCSPPVFCVGVSSDALKCVREYATELLVKRSLFFNSCFLFFFLFFFFFFNFLN